MAPLSLVSLGVLLGGCGQFIGHNEWSVDPNGIVGDINITAYRRSKSQDEATVSHVPAIFQQAEAQGYSELCRARMEEIATVNKGLCGSNASASLAEFSRPFGRKIVCVYLPKGPSMGTWVDFEVSSESDWRPIVDNFLRSKLENPLTGALPTMERPKSPWNPVRITRRNFREPLVLGSNWVPSLVQAGSPPLPSGNKDSYINRDLKASLKLLDYSVTSNVNSMSSEEFQKANQGITRQEIKAPPSNSPGFPNRSPGTNWIIKKGNQVVVLRVSIQRDAPADLEPEVDKIALDVQRILQDVPSRPSPIKHNSSSDEHDRTALLGAHRG